MKKQIIVYCLGVLCLVGHPVFSGGGTNVGGGGGANDEQYYPHRHEAGEASEHPWESLSSWCSETRGILLEYKQLANLARGNFQNIRNIFVEGLTTALNNYKNPETEVPVELLTMKSISRALALNSLLTGPQDQPEREAQQEQEVVVELLSHFYTFIIEVNIQFDQRYTIPYFHSQHRCGSDCQHTFIVNDHFYTEYGKYVVKLLSFGMDRAIPMGSSHRELLLFESLTGWAKDDLALSVLSRNYECIQEQLSKLHTHIHKYLEGYRTYFSDSRVLLVFTRHRVENIIHELEHIESHFKRHGDNCFSAYHSLGGY